MLIIRCNQLLKGFLLHFIFLDNSPCRRQFKCHVSTHAPRPASSAQTKIAACLSEIPSQICNWQIEPIVTQIELLIFSHFSPQLIQSHLIHIHSNCCCNGCLAMSFSHTSLLLLTLQWLFFFVISTTHSLPFHSKPFIALSYLYLPFSKAKAASASWASQTLWTAP